ADHAIDRVAGRRHHDDADLAAPLAQPAGDGEAILAGQADIEQHQCRQFAFDQAAQACSRVETGDAVALLAEIVEQELTLARLPLDPHYMPPRVHFSLPSA